MATLFKRPQISQKIVIPYLTIMLSCVLSACASPSLVQQFDFGKEPEIVASTSNASAPLLTIQLAEIQVPISLESSAMLYRLTYENSQELKPYAQSRWSMPPAQLLKQRIKTQINRLGGAVVSSSDGVKALPLVRLELEEFSQHFSNPQQSQVQLRWRASLIKNNQLLGQKVFNAQALCLSPDAKGGARAMPQASDMAIMELISWLQTQLK